MNILSVEFTKKKKNNSASMYVYLRLAVNGQISSFFPKYNFKKN